MPSSLQLIETRQFGDVAFQCYQDEESTQAQDFWATREQIGQLLGYTDPTDAIYRIHDRHKDRLDKFSRTDRLSIHEENRDVTREIILYNFKGLLEICRFSNQPNANRVIDFIWDIADEIRRTGQYAPTPTPTTPPVFELMEAAIKVFQLAGLTGNHLALAADRIYQRHTGYSALQQGQVVLVNPVQRVALTPTQLGKELEKRYAPEKLTAVVINKLLYSIGYQRPLGEKWEPTDLGRQNGATLIDTGKSHNDGSPVTQLKWYSTLLPTLVDYIDSVGISELKTSLKALVIAK